jgi:Clathrin-H-link/Clathrin, heavy-chain linker
VGLNEGSLVPYIVSQLRDSELAIAIASRLNLPGADDLYQQQFTQLLQQGDVQGAAKVAAGSPRGLLRTPQTIQMFQQVPAQPGQPQPVFQYFSVLLERGKLNHMESVELAKPVLEQGELVLTCSCSSLSNSQRNNYFYVWIRRLASNALYMIVIEEGEVILVILAPHYSSCIILIILIVITGRPQLLEKWIAEDKLEMSEELGDLLMPADVNMALTVYQRANCPEKVINCLMQKGESDKIVAYSTSVGYRVDYTFMLQQLVRTNPQVRARGISVMTYNTAPTIFTTFPSVSHQRISLSITLQ